jgi:ribosomal protein S18 acetylase RimI-like enzyme
MSDATDFARAVAFRHENAVRRADRGIRTAHGNALFTDDLPLVWFLNQLLVDLGTRAEIEELVAEADATLGAANLAHRWVSVDDDFGVHLAPGFSRLGWTVEKQVVMVHDGSLHAIDTSAVVETGPDEQAPFWAESWRDQPEMASEEAIPQLVEARYPRRNGFDVRYYTVRAEAGIAGWCELFSDGSTGQIENVMVLERFRGRGIGKALTAHALDASRETNDLTFLVADADDWPRHLYAKLGFEPTGDTWVFTRRPPTS